MGGAAKAKAAAKKAAAKAKKTAKKAKKAKKKAAKKAKKAKKAAAKKAKKATAKAKKAGKIAKAIAAANHATAISNSVKTAADSGKGSKAQLHNRLSKADADINKATSEEGG